MQGNHTFADKYCQQFHCPRPDFGETVLWQCLPVLRKPLARLLWLGNSEHFESDIHLIHEIGRATTVEQAREIIKFYNQQPSVRSFTRQRLKVRLSRGKLQALVNELLGTVKPDQAAGTFAGKKLAPIRTRGNWR